MTEESQAKPGSSAGQAPETVNAVVGFCRDLLQRLKMELEIDAKLENTVLTVNLSGTDRPLMLSNAAAVLNSMEYLVNKAFRTEKCEQISAIVFDSDKYRQHREAELVLLAQMASKKVLTQRRPLSLQPMTPRERRIVHLALAEIEGVRSQSEGDGDNRSITIYPS
ncbi:MAG TPA: R3H domain-containing nucleic acid-binding protein [Acidobacteriota bacterium]|nr:R3H domain-containing nucleic acid-binding protein [Acidobacteriota bacterium]